jgi:aspartate/methionine/tyrosine aminotransferase
MKLDPFLLDEWLDAAMDPVPRWNLGSVAGPAWRLGELLDLATEDERAAIMSLPLGYSRAAGSDQLRAAIAGRYDAQSDDVLVVTGASEAILLVFVSAAGPGANAVLPAPCFPPMVAIPRALGFETRTYRLRPEDEWSIDLNEVGGLVDSRTAVVAFNSPHNPTGAVVDDETKRNLRSIADRAGATLVADEVFHPIYHGRAARSAAAVGATIVSDASKAFSLPGLRIGWIIEHDPERREQYLRGRMNFTGTNSPLAEQLAVLAMQNAETIVGRTQRLTSANLHLLDRFMSRWSDELDWVKPSGGTCAFPWLRNGSDARPLCEALLASGVLTVPGDVFGQPSFFRVSFGAEEAFGPALEAAYAVLETTFGRNP